MPKDLLVGIGGSYISSVICQRIHELIVAIREGKSKDSPNELMNLTKRYGKGSSIKVLSDLLSDVLIMTDRKSEKNGREISFLSQYLTQILSLVDCKYLLDNAFSQIELKGACISYSTFLSMMGMDDFSKCVFSIQLLSIKTQPFGKDVNDVLKQCMKSGKWSKDHNLFPIYKTDVMLFVKQHKELWSEEENAKILQMFTKSDSPSLASLSLLFSIPEPHQVYSPIATSNSLSLLPEIGCVLCCNEEILTSFIKSIYNTHPIHFDEQEVALVLIKMANSEIVNDLSSQIMLSRDILADYKIVLPKDIFVHCWDAKMVTVVLKKLDPSLDFQKVFALMDCEAFTLVNQSSLQFLIEVWKEAGIPNSIVSLLNNQWKVKTGEISFIKQLLQAPPDVFANAKPSALLTNHPNFVVPETFKPWCYEAVLEGVLSLLETNLFDETKSLLSPIIKQEPSLLLLLLLYTPSSSYMKRYLLDKLVIQVLSSSIPFSVMEVLQKAIQPCKPTIVDLIEVFLRTHDSVPNTMLLSINQLGLQDSLLTSSNHTVFNQLFVKNWSSNSANTKSLEETLYHRIDHYGATVLNSMVSFIIAHASDFEKASQPLFSLVRLIEQSEVSYHFIDTNVVTPIKEVIESLTALPALKVSWDSLVQAEAKKMMISLQKESNDWDLYCEDIKKLRHSQFSFDYYVYHAFLRLLYSSIQGWIDRKDITDTTPLLTLIKALGLLLERRILEEEEKETLKEVILIMDNAASSPLGVIIYQTFLRYISACLRDHIDLESQLRSNPNIQVLQRNASIKQSMTPSMTQCSPFTMPNMSYPAAPSEVVTLNHSMSSHTLSRSASLMDTAPVRSTGTEAISMELLNCQPLDDTKSQLVKRLMNQLGANNMEMITSKLFTEITPDLYPSFALVFVEGYISRQEVFTQVYLDMVLSLHDNRFEELMIDACILIINKILREKDDTISHQQLLRIARFLGGMTIGRDRVLPYRKINIKKMLFNSIKESRVVACLLFTCELLSSCEKSTVLKCPSQPWVHSLLVSLWALHTDPRISESRSQYVPNLFDSFTEKGYGSIIDSIKKEAESSLNTYSTLSPSLSYSSLQSSAQLSHTRSQSGLSPMSSLPPSQNHLQHSLSMHSGQPHLSPAYNNSLLTSKSVSYSPSINHDSDFEVYLNSQSARFFKDTGMSTMIIKQVCRDIWKTVKNEVVILLDQPPLKDLLNQDLSEEVTSAINQCCMSLARSRFDNINKLFLSFFKQQSIMYDTSDFSLLIVQYYYQYLTVLVKEQIRQKSNTILNSINESNSMSNPGWMNQHINLHDHLIQFIRGYINTFRMYFQRLYIQQGSLPKESNLAVDLQNMFLSIPFNNQTDLQSDPRFLFLVDYLHYSFFDTPDTRDVNIYQTLLPVILNVNKKTVNIPIQPAFESVLRTMIVKNTPISISFLGTCIKQQYIQVSFFDNFLTKLLSSSQKAPCENAVVSTTSAIIQKLMIDSETLYANKTPLLMRWIAEATQSITDSSPLYTLKQTVLKLQRKYEMLVQETTYLPHFKSVLQAWYELCSSAHSTPSEEDTVTFIMALKKKGLFVSETQTVIALRMLFIAVLDMKDSKEISPARSLAALIITLIRYTDVVSKSSLLLCALTSISSVLSDEFKSGNTRGNQPALQILMDLLQYVLNPLLPGLLNPSSSSVGKSETATTISFIRCYLYGLNLLQPESLPSFSYCWITLLSNNSLIQLVKGANDTVLQGQFKNLILCYLRFMRHFMLLEVIPDSLDCHLKSLTSFLLELKSVWPELLSKYYGEFCVLIPMRYIQLHNIITSAEPTGIKQFKPYESITDEMNRCFRQPTKDYWDTSSILTPLDLGKTLKQYMETKDNSILNELANLSRKHLLSPEYFAMLYEIPFTLFMKYGFCDKEYSFPVDYFCDLVKMLIKENLMIPLHETLLSILDHVRYPSTDTYSYCMLMKTLMKREGRDTVITTLCERLLVPGPKSWGLHFLFIQLVNSEKDNIKELKCYKSNPAIRNLVDEYMSRK